MTTWKRFKKFFSDDPESTGTQTEPVPKQPEEPDFVLVKREGVVYRQHKDGRLILPRTQEEINKIKVDEETLRRFNAGRKPGEKLYGSIEELERDLYAPSKQWTNY